LAATANPTVALALPLAPLAIVIQGALLTVFQEHPVSVVTANETDPPAESIDARAGAIENVQGAAAWSSASSTEPTVSFADRGDGTGFSETV
jgi:hypothetical protein